MSRRQSFDELALPHLEMIYRVARRLTRREHEAEDLAQETFLKAHKAFASFEMRDFGIKPWLLKILHNTYLNRQARETRAPRATDQQNLDKISHEEFSTSLPNLDYEQLDTEVKQAIDALPSDFRMVLLLWSTMELSYQEIADSLGLPIGTVMSRLHRARQQLARALATYAAENRLLGTQDTK